MSARDCASVGTRDGSQKSALILSAPNIPSPCDAEAAGRPENETAEECVEATARARAGALGVNRAVGGVFGST